MLSLLEKHTRQYEIVVIHLSGRNGLRLELRYPYLGRIICISSRSHIFSCFVENYKRSSYKIQILVFRLIKLHLLIPLLCLLRRLIHFLLDRHNPLLSRLHLLRALLFLLLLLRALLLRLLLLRARLLLLHLSRARLLLLLLSRARLLLHLLKALLFRPLLLKALLVRPLLLKALLSLLHLLVVLIYILLLLIPIIFPTPQNSIDYLSALVVRARCR